MTARKRTYDEIEPNTSEDEKQPPFKRHQSLSRTQPKSMKHILIERFLTKLGHESFRSKQEEIINDVVDGRNVFLTMATGMGKSLCFQIAILVRNTLNNIQCNKKKPGIGIVISPLLALMSDQVQKLQSKRISARYWNSSLNSTQKYQFRCDLMQGSIDIVYTTPESLFSRTNGIAHLLMQYCTVTTFCIDEAHCMYVMYVIFFFFCAFFKHLLDK